ncbi:MAG: hypothetical protein FWH35_00850 [Treponema sp.]|nr:hypothetical protein [Treponema sp.]
MKYKAWVLFLALFLFAGCKGVYSPGEEKDETEIPPFEPSSEVFEESINETGESITRLYVKDNKYWTKNGFTLWMVWGNEETGTFKGREVTISKSRGQEWAGFGLIICHGTREIEDVGKVETMLTLMINVRGEYTLGKVINGTYESLIWWTASPQILKGYGAPNKIKIIKEGEALKIFINGAEVLNFLDDTEPKHTGGRHGYVAVVSPLDRFDLGDEVDIYFTERK